MPLSKRLQGIASLIRSTVTEAKKVGDDEDALDDALKLAEDIEERLLPAVGDTMVFNRRGRHVLLSLARSHLLQQCGNSGSGSLQLYGGISPFFVEQRDVLLKAFETY
ncbi:hypothetical protein FRB99_004726 [Tulasnella sp. 403]|nr:hypothetical protein FRB99_004726 [Tulasnella sp. 403]